MPGFAYPAPAKLNLFLHVIGRRSDGYHLLETLFRFIDCCDQLRFAARDDDVIKRAGAEAILPERDLCVRAAQTLQREAGCPLGVDIFLEKRIPVGAGLGGGSSDAATTLLALNRLWEINWPRERLMQIALQLGADVPVFIFGEAAFAQGIGEQLTAYPLPPQHYVVLTPPVVVSTAEIFADPQLTRNSPPLKMSAFSMGHGRNDLEPVACRRNPVIAEHLQWLNQFGDARMTGSGGAVFAAFDSEPQAREVIERLPASMQGFVARSLDRHPLRDA
jgi:4-diphosphocytidyl-2-C-methyl-D-erythritol kinase